MCCLYTNYFILTYIYNRLKNEKHVAQVEYNEVFGCNSDVGFKIDWLVPVSVKFPDSMKDKIFGYCIEPFRDSELTPLTSRLEETTMPLHFDNLGTIVNSNGNGHGNTIGGSELHSSIDRESELSISSTPFLSGVRELNVDVDDEGHSANSGKEVFINYI